MPLSILHVVMTFHRNSSAGGPIQNVYAYSQGLMTRGHSVSVCCSDRLTLNSRVQIDDWDRGISSPTHWDGIEVSYVRSYHLGYGGYGTVIAPALCPYLMREISKYDVVHLHGAWNTFNVVGGVVASLKGVPFVVQLHNTYGIRLNRVILKRLFHLLVRRRWLDRAAAIIALTPSEKEEYLASRPKDRSKTYIVPAAMPSIERVPARGQFRQEWGIPRNAYLILYLGRLHKGKGLDYLLEAVSRLDGSRIALVIVGPDAGYEAQIRDRTQTLGLSDKVIFTGPIYGSRKYTAFRDADVFVLPSMFEQLPISALEAAIFRLPLVLSERCGMTDVVLETEAGIIVPYGETKALAEALESLCDDPLQRRRMGSNAREMVEEYCDPSQVIDTLEAVYQSALTV